MAAKAKNQGKIVEALKHAYEMEIETVINYLANSIHLDGVLAMEVRESLEADIQEELGHAKKLADRLKVLDAPIPGSLGLKFNQKKLQPPKNTTDVKSVILGVIQAEEEAIEHYAKIIQLTDGVDYVTQDLVIALKGDEEMHRREFTGFLRDFEAHPGLTKK